MARTPRLLLCSRYAAGGDARLGSGPAPRALGVLATLCRVARLAVEDDDRRDTMLNQAQHAVCEGLRHGRVPALAARAQHRHVAHDELVQQDARVDANGVAGEQGHGHANAPACLPQRRALARLHRGEATHSPGEEENKSAALHFLGTRRHDSLVDLFKTYPESLRSPRTVQDWLRSTR